MNEAYTGKEVLRLFTKYAVNRNNYIAKLIERFIPYGKGSTIDILEFGAGSGEFINRFKGRDGMKTYAVEIDDELRMEIQADHVHSSLEESSPKFDYVFLIDVLEHLEDDEAHLRQFFDCLSGEGSIFIYVPARKELFSAFDKGLGHFRRYSRKELMNKLNQAGFIIQDCRYHEILGYFAAFLNKLSGQKVPGKVSLLIYDRIVVVLSNFIERFIRPPFGKSLYVIARKPKEVE